MSGNVIKLSDFMPKPGDDGATMCSFNLSFLGSVTDAVKFITGLRQNGCGELADAVLEAARIVEIDDE